MEMVVLEKPFGFTASKKSYGTVRFDGRIALCLQYHHFGVVYEEANNCQPDQTISSHERIDGTLL